MTSILPLEILLMRGFLQLLDLLIHDNPAATIIEFASDMKALSHATVPRLAKGTVLPSQVKYAVVAGVHNDVDLSNMSLVGDVFSLGDLSEADNSSADLLVVPQAVGALADLDNVLNRLATFGKPTSAIILSGVIDSKEVSPALGAHGFRCLIDVPGAALYKRQPEHINGNGTNGAAPNRREFVIIEPSPASTTVQSFSAALQKALKNKDYNSVVTAWKDLSSVHFTGSDGEVENKTFISLAELDVPLLETLSEPDFAILKKLVTNCESLLWVTGGQSPSTAVVDGLSRTARNENASLNFQVLHLLSNPELDTDALTTQHHQKGPSLAIRLLDSLSCKDYEFREHKGLLQVSRFYKSLAGNEAVRYCLEDSTRMQPLKQNKNDNNTSSEALRLTIGKPGLLDSLTFIHDDRLDGALGNMEIEVDVKATGVK